MSIPEVSAWTGNVFLGEKIVAVGNCWKVWSWIYHNATLWIISLSNDWSNWITIADKNLWATQVWNEWDTLSQANCWNFYQWWNCYWFPFTWTTSTSSSTVSASWYWPNNYYSNSTFRTVVWAWDSSKNNDLWWDVTNTNSARKWPCANWYHIPSKDDFDNLYNILSSLSRNVKYLKIPLAWELSMSDWTRSNTNRYNLWSSSHFDESSQHRAYESDWSSMLSAASYTHRSRWYQIRPFKNDSVIPDVTWTKLY